MWNLTKFQLNQTTNRKMEITIVWIEWTSLKLCEVSQNSFSNRCRNFQLFTLINKKVLYVKKMNGEWPKMKRDTQQKGSLSWKKDCYFVGYLSSFSAVHRMLRGFEKYIILEFEMSVHRICKFDPFPLKFFFCRKTDTKMETRTDIVAKIVV